MYISEMDLRYRPRLARSTGGRGSRISSTELQLVGETFLHGTARPLPLANRRLKRKWPPTFQVYLPRRGKPRSCILCKGGGIFSNRLRKNFRWRGFGKGTNSTRAASSFKMCPRFSA